MKNLKKSLVLLFAVFIASYAIDKILYFAISTVSEDVFTGQAIGKLNQFFLVKDKVDILVLGSSRANHHIDVKLISENGFNIGADGTKIAYLNALTKTLPINKKQKLIVNIDAKNLFSKYYDGSDVNALNTRYHKSAVISENIDALGKSNPLRKIYWLIDYNTVLLGIVTNYIKPKYDYKTYFGYDPISLTDTQKKIRTKILSQIKKTDCSKIDITVNQLSEKLIIDLNQFCLDNSKDLIVVTTPLFNDTCKEDNKIMSDFFKNLNIKYIDYSDFFIKDNNIDLWKDETHLTKLGAGIFTKALKKSI